jgi:hypothetical protein
MGVTELTAGQIKQTIALLCKEFTPQLIYDYQAGEFGDCEGDYCRSA